MAGTGSTVRWCDRLMAGRRAAAAALLLLLLPGHAPAGLLLDRGSGAADAAAPGPPAVGSRTAVPEAVPLVAPPDVLQMPAPPDVLQIQAPPATVNVPAPPDVRAQDSDLPPTRAAVDEHLRNLPCALVSVEEQGPRMVVTGVVAGAEANARLAEALDDLFRTRGPEESPARAITVAPDGLCEPLRLLRRPLAASASTGLAVLPAGGGRDFAAGDPLMVDIRGPAFASHLRVDYYTVDGLVVHLLPNPLESETRMPAGRSRRLGDRSAGGRFWTIGPPFGVELLTVLASRDPVLPQPRPEAEPAAAYLAELRRALDSAAPPTAAAALFIRTGKGLPTP